MTRRAWAVALALYAQPAICADPPARHAILLSIDGLMPSVYTGSEAGGPAVPNLRRLAAAGAFARGVVGVLPTVTYPSHTTLITGVPPRVHGIAGNVYFDPMGLSNDAWRWYARDVRVPTLVGAARSAGRSTASVSWPVSVGMDADWLFADFWRTESKHPSDLELLRALSTPGLLEATEAARQRPVRAPVDDETRMDIALTILRTRRPGLLLLHLLEVDSAAHDFGPSAPETRAALERADAELGRLLRTIRELGMEENTLVAIVSDHGFLDVERVARPNTLLVENGLAELDEQGNAKTWKAWFLVHGGGASLYLADPKDEETRGKARALFAAKMADPESGIREILDGDRLAALGSDAEAEFFLDARDGFTFSRTARGGWYGTPSDRGYHGYSPERPAMHAALILSAPQLRERGDLGVVPMTRIAATVARFLGIELPPPAAPALPVF